MRYITLLLLFLVACGDNQITVGAGGGGGGGPAEGEGPEGPPEEGESPPEEGELPPGESPPDEPAEPEVLPLPFACNTGKTVEQGWNAGWSINNITRRFYADLPPATDKPIFVVFSFYGVGDNVLNWRNYFAPNVAADADFTFAHITFQDTRMTPFARPQGLVWDMFESINGDDNREALLFEETLGCLQKNYKIHAQGIYAVGFSGGAIMSALLASRYPTQIGAIVALSGAWFSDPEQAALVQAPAPLQIEWSPLTETMGTVLLSHGGVRDVFSPPASGNVLSFEEAHQKALPFLKKNLRSVVDCAHTRGHVPLPGLTPALVLNFFKAHRAGSASPYLATGLPVEYQQLGCTLLPP